MTQIPMQSKGVVFSATKEQLQDVMALWVGTEFDEEVPPHLINVNPWRPIDGSARYAVRITLWRGRVSVCSILMDYDPNTYLLHLGDFGVWKAKSFKTVQKYSTAKNLVLAAGIPASQIIREK